jgi:hypothetical protein
MQGADAEVAIVQEGTVAGAQGAGGAKDIDEEEKEESVTLVEIVEEGGEAWQAGSSTTVQGTHDGRGQATVAPFATGSTGAWGDYGEESRVVQAMGGSIEEEVYSGVSVARRMDDIRESVRGKAPVNAAPTEEQPEGEVEDEWPTCAYGIQTLTFCIDDCTDITKASRQIFFSAASHTNL